MSPKHRQSSLLGEKPLEDSKLAFLAIYNRLPTFKVLLYKLMLTTIKRGAYESTLGRGKKGILQCLVQHGVPEGRGLRRDLKMAAEMVPGRYSISLSYK